MVFFTCNACGQSVKKNQVENHTYQCRDCQSVSCMDCNKEFWGNEYKEHIKCISESEKYGPKDFKPKESSNKGELKQALWIQHINSTLETKKISGPLSGLLQQITQYTNIPRKKAKFENFLVNSLKIRNPKLISDAWEIFDQGKKNETELPNKNNSNVNGTISSNGTNTVNGINTPKESGKRPCDNDKSAKRICMDSSPSNIENQEKSIKFNWCAACEEILQNFPTGLREKTLRKKVIEKYRTFVGDSNTISDSKLKTMIREELSKNSNFCLYIDPSK